MRTVHYDCKECGNKVIPQWNPYDGVWECPTCWEELEEGPDNGPRDTDIRHTNRNPQL